MNHYPGTSSGQRTQRPGEAYPVPIQDLNYRPEETSGFFDVSADDRKPFVEYFHAILYRKWIVFGIFIFSLAVATLYALRATPYYKSSATIEIEKVYPSSAGLNELFAFFGQFDLYYQTQLESLKSRNLAEKFLERMNAAPNSQADNREEKGSGKEDVTGKSDKPDTNALLEEEKRKVAAVNSIVSRISVNPVRGTQLIQVELGADDPVLAKKMLGTYLDTFIEEDRQRRAEIVAKVKNWLRTELMETEKQLKESEANLLEFSKKHGMVYLSKHPNQALSSFERASDSLLQSQDLRVNLESLEPDKTKGLPPQVSNDYLQNLRGQLAGLKSEYTGMKAIYSPNYFKMNLLKNKIRSMEEAIADLEKEAVASALEAAKKKEELTGEAYEKSKQAAIDMNSLAVQFDILKKMVEANSQAYVMLLQKTKQAEIDQGFMGHNITVVNQPTLPLLPVSPNVKRIILLGAIFGLLGGIGLAVFLDYFDGAAQTEREIEKSLRVRILGAVPRIQYGGQDAYGTGGSSFQDLEAKAGNLEFVAHRFPTAPFTDAIRIVHNTASTLVPGTSGATMCISSSLPLEGKTLISVVMATVVASENKKVLVIDGDLRRPRIHHIFNSTAHDSGLSDLITGKCLDIKDVIRKSSVPGLYYMTSGTPPENPVALLKSERTQDIMEACRKAFDFIVLDAPPVLGLVDATILSGYADGLILVAKAGSTPVEVLRRAKESVFRGQVRLLGIVLNMADEKARRYNYYRYRYYGYNEHYSTRTA
ncbi:MAG TPA: polysaccharide biosynthesis tyrosine autokinase [Desulfomonilaceae bacterium]|nr:polysaccharide biosynthesis tyrosine autokinase [Desulfomonilaceae bacterium]